MKRMWSKNELKNISQNEAKAVKKDIATLVDSQGHERFIEGDIEIGEISGITKKYGKWSLSGSHLLIVLSVDIADTTVISSATRLSIINFPKWIYDKIVPLYSSFVVISSFYAYASSGTAQSFGTSLRKYANPDSIQIILDSAVTLTADRNLRMNFDLLID